MGAFEFGIGNLEVACDGGKWAERDWRLGMRLNSWSITWYNWPFGRVLKLQSSDPCFLNGKLESDTHTLVVILLTPDLSDV